jgi:hypothetical protein
MDTNTETLQRLTALLHTILGELQEQRANIPTPSPITFYVSTSTNVSNTFEGAAKTYALSPNDAKHTSTSTNMNESESTQLDANTNSERDFLDNGGNNEEDSPLLRGYHVLPDN